MQVAGNLRSWKGRDWLFGLLLVAVTLVAYQPAWNGKPIWDDENHLTAPEFRSLHGLARIWTEPGATQQYYPLVFSAFWVGHKLWGDKTLGYHLVNILLHVFSALLFLRILRKLEVPGAWLAAAIFALHPVHVESVAWMTELKNTLSGVFYLGSALVYLRFDRSRTPGAYVLALGLFVLGLMSKTVIAPLPAALLVVFWWKRGKLSWQQDVWPLVPFFFAGLAAGLFTLWMEQKVFGAEGHGFQFTFIERCLIAGRSIWFHLGKLFWPADLIFMYPRWKISAAVWWQYLYPAAAVLLLAGLWALRRRNRGPLAALLFFAGMLSPALGFFNAYSFRYSFVNDHHQYLASLGIITLASAGIALLLDRWRLWQRPAGWALSLILLVTLAGLTWRQSGTYADVEKLYRPAIAKDPNSWFAYYNLGTFYAEHGQIDEAIPLLRKAVEAKTDFTEAHYNLGTVLLNRGQVDEAITHFQTVLQIEPGHALAWYNLGRALLQQGRTDEAIAHYRKSLEIYPNHADAHRSLGSALLGKGQAGEAIAHFQKAVEIQPDHVAGRLSLGNALLGQGRMDEAMTHFQKVLQLRPDSAEVRYNVGIVFLQAGKADEAAACFQKCLAIRPDFAEAHNNLGSALLMQGRQEQAIAHFRKALEIQPHFMLAQNNLAWALATSPDASVRNGAKAVELALEADRLSGSQNPIVLMTLGAAYAEAGRFPEAVATAQRALQLAAAQNNTGLANTLQLQIGLYQTGSPFRTPAQTNAPALPKQP